MKLSKKQLLVLFITVIIIGFISLYKLPYYIYMLGKATDLEEIILLDNKNDSKGSYNILTVGSRPATQIIYGIAKLSSHNNIVPLKEARPDGISDEEYRKKQLELMENSQEAALVVAFEEADADIDITYNGV